MKNKILYFPANNVDQFRTGGTKRTHQIFTFLNSNFTIINKNDLKFHFCSRIKRYIIGYKFLKKIGAPLKSLKNIAVAGYNYTNYQRLIKNEPNLKCYIWESTITGYKYIPNILKDLGLSLIIFPHNFEALVINAPLPDIHSTQLSWYNEELNLYRQCSHVFTISKEEHWLLTLNGIPTSFFPYWPSNEVVEKLKQIRKDREIIDPENFYLIFGSFFYPPIKAGYLALINNLVKNNIIHKIKIAGFRSEELKSLYPNLPSNIELLGSVSNEELNDLLKKCEAVIINQEASSGALTKLAELQVAGVPVIANTLSLRSYDNTKGFYAYNNFDELNELISKTELQQPLVPQKSIFIESNAVNVINDILSQQT